MRVLVTGATGFIGRYLVKRLVEEDHEVICLVRKTSKIDFLKKLEVEFVVGDILNAREVDNLFLKEKPEAVFHCAAKVLGKDESELLAVNAESTRNICRACYNFNVRRLIYLSSISVINGNQDMMLTDDLSYKSRDAYGKSKIEAERLAIEFRKKGLKLSIIRPCMVYGEGEPHIMDKILRLVKMRLLPLFEMPGMDSKLTLVHVENVVQVLMLAFENEKALEGTFLVADREVITPRRFIEILYDEMKSGKPIVIPAGVMKFFMWLLPPVRRRFNRLFKDRTYDISRAINLLGYNPRFSTEEGLRQTVRAWKIKHV